MTKKKRMEMIAILSLSSLLTSALTVSGTVPALLETFSSYPRASVETLISIPSISMVAMIAASPFLAKIVNERITIILGLILAGAGGIFPFFTSSYSLIFAARIVLGLGLGLINTRAISIIGERFEGTVRTKLLGFRSSMEAVSQAAMTLIVGQLLSFGWHVPFLVYSFAFVVLLLYILFVPNDQQKSTFQHADSNTKEKLTTRQRALILVLTVFLGLMIATNVANALRIPSYVVENKLASISTATTLLSMSLLAGFFAGLLFSTLLLRIKKPFLFVMLLSVSIGMLVIPLSSSSFFVGAGAMICGFTLTNCISYSFTLLSETIPVTSLNTATAIVLIGCNIGATLTPLLLEVMGLVNTSLATPFFLFAGLYVVLALIMPKVLSSLTKA